MKISEKRIPNVVVGLTLFWLGIAQAFFWNEPFNIHFIPMWLGSIFVGIFMAKSSSDEFRDLILRRLKYNYELKLPVGDRRAFSNQDRGVVSSLGGVPFFRQAMPCVEQIEKNDLLVHSPPELKPEHFDRLFSDVFSKSGPNTGLERLADRTVRTLCYSKHIKHPAGVDRHGGRSLLTHTLLVTALMLHQAKAYTYDPKRHTPNNPNFKLDPKDPLIPALGFLHDIGKLVKFIVNSNTNAVTIHADHSSESARIASDFPEYWDMDISCEDRLLLQDAISYSWQLNALPIKKSTMARPRPSSDRLYALVDLLSSCDVLASSIEMGAGYDFGVEPVFETVQTLDDINAVNVYEEFLNFATIKADINALNGIKSVGFRYKGMIDGVMMNVIVFDEKKFSEDFSKYLEKPDLNAKEDKRSVITGIVLGELDENGILVRDPKDVGLRPAKDCLYKIVFTAPNSNGTENAIVLSSAFVISLDGVERFATLEKTTNCHAVPSFSNSIYGSKKFKSTGTTILEDVALESLGIKPTGQKKVPVSIATLIKPPPAPNSALTINFIRMGLKNKKIVPTTVQTESSGVLHVVGYNKFFNDLGIKLEESSGGESLSSIGIKSIRRSKKNPDDFIVDLCGDIYGNLNNN
ncbi:hypothetical protein [Rhodoferax antarcticus]|uniref:HD domain-containing protein n=1 Tax=Rhodoferax antarcticus ANT.BR TaxID=1111071 RepID=A0A1Q8Y956_9BURK|nr:hypothetical protein [Rhodoferax antarcticus]OLP04509.1 hypothetical protein BLL52_4179 [Rhodoferax antarcticus ANT.BR]